MQKLGLIACCAILAGCSNATDSSLPAAITPVARTIGSVERPALELARQPAGNSASFKLIYAFKTSPDGAFPLAPLLNVGGVLYGTTSQGGTNTANGTGTVFSITPAGKERILHNFAGGSDGEFPQAGLIEVNGTLYGTAPNGGSSGDGVVYKITRAGAESVVYSFAGGADGAAPEASLLDDNGTLVGSTLLGGGGSCADGSGCGTVFSVTAGGAEHALHAFVGGADGALPSSDLTAVNGTLYGTTFSGGGSGCNFKGCGTIFKITPDGTESVVYSFQGGADGANPDSGLLNVRATLYGTTAAGGKSNNGTVFSVTPSGAEAVIHQFRNGSDGADPEAGLIVVNNTLYGTTFAGGKNTLGTIFAMTLAGATTILYNFSGPADGANPSARLINVKGVLYGTAKTGGGAGNGTVFSFVP